ncbi:unnamed protein product [Effrenium voratum]|uniref:Adenosine kinase n=1 Tax=Effrenium voratum TaxID=2562239 RepID=A0AA36MGT4_9DINO|nr:unnamed protein product [Effrenium voratum]CAJ1446844.1 unnamed protein product [Effrenium voratum]
MAEPPEEVAEFVLDARYGDDEAVDAALGAGVQVDAQSHGGSTALLMASANGHTAIVRRLLQARAAPSLANDAGNCPLHWAALNGHLEVVRALLEARANANARNDFKKRPFDEALSKSNEDICEALASATCFDEDVPEPEAQEEDSRQEQPVILGMGNPLLDISAEVPEELLGRYGLKTGDAILAEPKHEALYQELAAMDTVKYVAGGATQNSIRVAQWMLQEPGMTAYMGCIGDDAFGRKLAKACEEDGVLTRYQVDKETPTGTCAVTIVDKERSLTTRLGAANKFTVSHVKEPENFNLLKSAKIVYSAGFFITVSPESIELACKVAEMSGGLYCLNLSAAFIVEVPVFRSVLEKALPHVDYLFGNETEARAYATAVGWDTADVAFIATRLSLVPMAGKKPPRHVVITQGAEPTVVARRGAVTLHEVQTLAPELIVDTNGAGDAFVGGFLAAVSKGRALGACCQAGSYAAGTVIQHSGCTFPEKPSYCI